MITQPTMHDIVRAALDEFAGASHVSNEDIDAFLAKLGVEDRLMEITIVAMEASMAELATEIKRRLRAGQTVGEAYKEGGK